MANRVSESSTSNTFLPWAAKNSATVVAASAARMRMSGDWSEVETTTTDRARPSAPSESRKKLAHLATALTHQSHHRHLGLGVARHHADQRALAHTRAAKDAHALAAPHGQQRIDRANACAQRLPMGTRSRASAPRRPEAAPCPGSARGRSSIGSPSAFNTRPISAGPTSISGMHS